MRSKTTLNNLKHQYDENCRLCMFPQVKFKINLIKKFIFFRSLRWFETDKVEEKLVERQKCRRRTKKAKRKTTHWAQMIIYILFSFLFYFLSKTSFSLQKKTISTSLNLIYVSYQVLNGGECAKNTRRQSVLQTGIKLKY